MREPLKSLGSSSWKNRSNHPMPNKHITTKKKSSKSVMSARLRKNDVVVTRAHHHASVQSPSMLLDNDVLMSEIFGNYYENEVPNNIHSLVDDSAALILGNQTCESSRQRRVTVTDPSESRRPRGPNKPQFAEDFPEKMVFNEFGAAVAPKKNVPIFSRFIARVATDPSVLPINAKDFRVLRKVGLVEKAWMIVKAAIDWNHGDNQSKEEKIKTTVEKKLDDRWRKFKYHLHKKFYLPYVGEAKRFECDDERVDIDQYKKLVKTWDEDGYIERRSRVGKRNRQELKTYSTNGSMSFAQLRHEWEIEHPNQVLDRCTFFLLSHSKKGEDGELPKAVNEATQQKFDMIHAIEQRENEAGNEVTAELRDQIFLEIFGPDDNNGVRGYGAGVQWQDVPGIVTTKKGFKHQVHKLQASLVESNEHLKEAQLAAEQAREEVNHLKEASALKDQQMEEELNSIRREMDVLKPLVGILEGVQSNDANSLQSLITLLTNVPGKQLCGEINGCSTMQQLEGYMDTT